MSVIVFFANLLLTGELSAQPVPASVKRQIGRQLDCDQQSKRIESVRVGSKKSGYLAYCYGGPSALVFEKKPSGITRIFSVEIQMNGSIELGTSGAGGYFDVLIESQGAMYSAIETFRWNGSRYTRVR